MEQLINSPFSATHIWVVLAIVAFLVTFYATSWLKDDLTERAGYKEPLFNKRGVFIQYAFRIMKSHANPKVRKKYFIALSSYLTGIMVILISFCMGIKSLDEDPCDNYAKYLNYSVDDTFSYRVKEGRRIDPVGIWLNSGPLDPCTYRLSGLYEYLVSGDKLMKAEGDSVLYVDRKGNKKAFVGTKQTFDCIEN